MRLPDEIAFLQSRGVRCVASDVPSFPLFAAREAGISSVAVANFTWHDIYAEYVQTPDDAALLAQMASEYAAATLACLTPLALPTVGDVFPNVERVPLVARRGHKVRAELKEALGVPAKKHLALLYLGNWGLDINWDALTQWDDWIFLTDRPVPQAVATMRAFDSGRWHYADVAASVDAVISKAGYGTLTECIANSVSLIYLPRAGFAEHEALVLGMKGWGGGVEISEVDFFAGNWGVALSAALAARPDPDVYPHKRGGSDCGKIGKVLPVNQVEIAQPKIVMYTRPGCPDVARASYYLRQRGVTWDDVDIEEDADAKQQVIAWTGRAVTPTLWIGDTMLIEPGEAEIDAALAKAS